jgi:hypothetical protein
MAKVEHSPSIAEIFATFHLCADAENNKEMIGVSKQKLTNNEVSMSWVIF